MSRYTSLVVLALLFTTACTLKDETSAPPDVAAAPSDAITTSSGLASKVLRVGLGGVRPGPRAKVTVHYTGWTTDGQMFESTVRAGEPATFGLDQVIPGWTEGLQLMVKGEKRRFWIPGHMAYDSNPRPDSPRGLLVFDIELLEIR